MIQLDPSLYPHIFDTIFEYADRASLLALRTASRGLRDRCDDVLARHLHIDLYLDDVPRHPAFTDLHLWDVLSAHLPCPWKTDREPSSLHSTPTALKHGGGEADPSNTDGKRRQPPRAAKRKRSATPSALSVEAINSPPSPSSPASPVRRSLTPSSVDTFRRRYDSYGIPSPGVARAFRLLQSVRVLDFGENRDATIDWMDYIPTRFPPLNHLHAVRFTVPPSSTPYPIDVVLPPVLGGSLPPLVWFWRLDPTAEGSAQHFRAQHVPTPRLTWTTTFDPFDTDLYHNERGGQAWVQPFYYHDTTESFVFIFVPDTSRHLRLRQGNRVVKLREQGSVDIHDVRNTMGVLGVLEDVVFHMAPELEREHTIVGVETMAPEMLGLEHGASDADKMTAVREGIRDMLVRRRDDPRDRVVHCDLWPDELVEKCVAAVDILTLDEYREKVGEERFGFETRV